MLQNSNVSTAVSSDARIAQHARQLSKQLQLLGERLFPPSSQKSMKTFTSGEAAQLLGVSDGYLRQLSLDGKGPSPDVSATGRRSYTLEQINELRHHIAAVKPKDAVSHLPWRRRGEKLQTIAVANFKGGSAKTTTTVYLAQFLALQGYRVLAIDLDPQASLSSMLGVQPEFDLQEGDTLYGAIRYDDKRRPLKEIVRKTYFAGLDLVPGNLELMEFEHETPTALIERKTSNQDIFFKRVGNAIAEVEANYDVVVIDCPPQLGYLTLTAMSAATSVLITVHPQMLDLMSMSQFLLMLGGILKTIKGAGAQIELDWFRYLITRYEPTDIPQAQMVGFMQSMLAGQILENPMLKSTAISDAGLTKQTLYEVEKSAFTRSTYDRAVESLDAVNSEIVGLIHRAWGRS